MGPLHSTRHSCIAPPIWPTRPTPPVIDLRQKRRRKQIFLGSRVFAAAGLSAPGFRPCKHRADPYAAMARCRRAARPV